jgi:peptidyl-prolyl cis-trans isomerase C
MAYLPDLPAATQGFTGTSSQEGFLTVYPRKDKFMKTHIAHLTSLCFVIILTTYSEPLLVQGAIPGPNKVSTEPAPAKTQAVAELNKPSETAVDSVAVTVNGIDIKESQIDAELETQLNKMAAQLPPALIEQYKKQLRPQVLEKMIIEQLLDEKVKAAKIVVTDEEVTERIKELASQQQPPLSMEDLKALIEASGKNFDEWKKQMQFSRRLAYQKLMETQWAGKINVTEDEVKKYYSENKSEFETPEQVRVSHILITPDIKDPNADPNKAKATAKAKAEDLLKQIKGGADFAELARANSDCPSSKQGGDLGFFPRGQMVPAFEDVAFALKPGQVSDIVETQFGYHIIKCMDHKDPNVISFEQAKEDIKNILTQNKEADFAEKYVNSLKAEAKIVYPPGKEPKEPNIPAVTAKPRPDKKVVPESGKKTPAKKKSSVK